MPNKKELEELLKEVIQEADTDLDKLIRELIAISISQKHKSVGSKQTRRDFMEKTMNQYLINSVKE